MTEEFGFNSVSYKRAVVRRYQMECHKHWGSCCYAARGKRGQKLCSHLDGGLNGKICPVCGRKHC